MCIRGVRRGRSIFRYELVVSPSIDFELASVPCQNLGFYCTEGVGIPKSKLNAILFSGAREGFDSDFAACRYFETPFPGWFEDDDAGRGVDGLRKLARQSCVARKADGNSK